MTLPNIISLARLLSAPLIVWLILREAWLAAFLAFALAGFSDAVDGFLAKRFDLATTLGTYLDPIADKVLLVAIYISLGVDGRLSAWLVILVVSRDVLLVGGAVLQFMLDEAIEIAPSFLSKLNTLLQIVLAATVLAALAFGRTDWEGLARGLEFLVGVTTVSSGAGYLISWSRRTARSE